VIRIINDNTGDSAEIAILGHSGEILHWGTRWGPVEWPKVLQGMHVNCRQYEISERQFQRWVNHHVRNDWSTDLSYWSKF
jgi:hypothetical protein